MAKVKDVAEFILQEQGTTSTFKLQKLLYYAQGWSLVWDEAPLFGEKIKAYENGPCIGALWREHRGSRHVATVGGDPAALTEDQRDTVRAVLEKYGHRSGDELVKMTHEEAPWVNVWDGDKSNAHEITVDALRTFFSSLRAAPQVPAPSTFAARLAAAAPSFRLDS